MHHLQEFAIEKRIARFTYGGGRMKLASARSVLYMAAMFHAFAAHAR